ncbi:hypothetical protein [Bacillus phage BM-P1]|nr:hypothetical protein [Bacillus phage BM-P1]
MYIFGLHLREADESSSSFLILQASGDRSGFDSLSLRGSGA